MQKLTKLEIVGIWLGILLILISMFGIQESFAQGFSLPPPDQANTGISPSQFSSESFQTDLFTGSTSTSVPIVVPPGTNGMAPSLALAYNSGSRKSFETIIAPGWDLVGLGYIERSTKKGAPEYNSSDTYVLFLGGSNELVFASDNYYHTEQERFLRIDFNAASDYWTVTDKSGTEYRFGFTANSRAEAAGGTRQWALDRVIDTHGNYMSISYDNDTSNGFLYPQTITYTQGNGLGVFRTVEFNYENRGDPVTGYRYRTPVTITKRLGYIDVKMNGAMVRRYELTYSASTSAQNDLLTQVQEFGNDANPGTRGTGTSLPPTMFEYTTPPVNPATGGNGDLLGTGSGVWMQQLSSDSPLLADFTGDGRTDVAYCQGNQWYMAVSTGGTFTQTGVTWGGPACATAGIVVVSFGDFDGDAMADLAVATPSDLDIYRSTGSSFTYGWSWTAPSATSPNPDMRGYLNDVSGDGKVDVEYAIPYTDCSSIGISGPCTGVWVQLSTGSGFGPHTEFNETVYTNSSYNVGALWEKFLDVDGDGKADFLLDRGSPNDNLYVGISTGGNFAGGNSGLWLDPHPTADVSLWRFGDFSGDGLLDFTILDPIYRKATVYLSQGNGFSSGQVWLDRGTETWYGDEFVYVGDFNGDGKRDLIDFQATAGNFYDVHLSSGQAFDAPPASGRWVSAAGGAFATLLEDFDGDGKTDLGEYFYTTSPYDFNVKLSSGPAIHLAEVINNSLGGSTVNTYEGSSAFLGNNLPFNIPIVKSVTLNDGMGNGITTSYDYQGGKYDPVTREFLGFNLVTVTDATGAYTQTTFNQTNELKGRPSQVETYDSSSSLFARTVNTWNYTTPYPGVTFPFLSQTDVYTYDGGGSAKQAQTKFFYDAYGNVNRIDKIGDTGIGSDNRYDYIEFAYNTTDWIVSLPKHLYTLASNNSTKVAESWNYYDNAAD